MDRCKVFTSLSLYLSECKDPFLESSLSSSSFVGTSVVLLRRLSTRRKDTGQILLSFFLVLRRRLLQSSTRKVTRRKGIFPYVSIQMDVYVCYVSLAFRPVLPQESINSLSPSLSFAAYTHTYPLRTRELHSHLCLFSFSFSFFLFFNLLFVLLVRTEAENPKTFCKDYHVKPRGRNEQ